MAISSNNKWHIVILVLIGLAAILTLLAAEYAPTILSQHASYNGFSNCVNNHNLPVYTSCMNAYRNAVSLHKLYEDNCTTPTSFLMNICNNKSAMNAPTNNCQAQLTYYCYQHYPPGVTPKLQQYINRGTQLPRPTVTSSNTCGCMYNNPPSKSYNYPHCDCGRKIGNTCSFTYVRNRGTCP